MSITVNRRKVKYVEGETIKRLMKRMRFIFPMVIVRIDEELVPREKYAETVIYDDAAVEIFHIESGG